jgi:hypothetical protein
MLLASPRLRSVKGRDTVTDSGALSDSASLPSSDDRKKGVRFPAVILLMC